MEFTVLISCMNQTDFSIVERSNLKNNNVLIINQCGYDSVQFCDNGPYKMINTTTKGLSKSRNLAIDNCETDIGLLCDDDEIFLDNFKENIIEAYNKFPDADMIIFKMVNRREKFGGKIKKLKKLDMLKVGSPQISFKVKSIRGMASFDTRMGAGTDNGGGEENKFLIDCYKLGMKIYYFPVEIASVTTVGSTWFFGYDENYFIKRGISTRLMLGGLLALLYAFYYVFTHKKLFKDYISVNKALFYTLKGIIDNKIKKEPN